MARSAESYCWQHAPSAFVHPGPPLMSSPLVSALLIEAPVNRHFAQLHRDGTTMVFVTHDAVIASAAQRVIRLRDGRVVSGVEGPVHP